VKLCAAKEQKEVLQSERSDGDRPKNIMKAFTQLSNAALARSRHAPRPAVLNRSLATCSGKGLDREDAGAQQ
jgi:hypothetical protein